MENIYYEHMEKVPHQPLKIFTWIILSALVIYTGFFHYSIYYSLIEMFCIIVSFIIAVVSYNSCNYSNKTATTMLGFTYLIVGSLNAFHVLTYICTDLYAPVIVKLGVNFSVISRYMEALVVLVMLELAYNRKSSVIRAFTVAMGFTLIAVSFSLMALDNINKPSFINVNGLTLIKIFGDLTCVIIAVSAVYLLYKLRKSIHADIFNFVFLYLISEFVEHFFFLVDLHLTDPLNMMGQLCRAFGFYFIYKCIVKTGIGTPFSLLFYNLSQANKELRYRTELLMKLNEELRKEVNERKMAEEKLIESEGKYSSIFELLPIGVCLMCEGRISFANEGFARLLGVASPKELIGRSRLEFIKLHPEYEDCKISQDSPVLTNPEQLPLMEQKYIRHDGKIIDVETVSIPFPGKDKLSVLTIMRDISEHKLVKELEKKIEMDKLLLQQSAEIDRVKTDFFANLSHELRTPLNVILGSLQLFELYRKSGIKYDEEKACKHMKVMKQNCQRLLRMVNNLIDSTKIDAGYFKLNMCVCNIVSVVEEITLSVADYTQGLNINLQFDTDTEEKYMPCDRDMIERIMLNLLSNAIKFTGSGGNIEVNINDRGNSIVITVKDDGIGIPKDKQSVIFDRFRQADRSLTKQYEGSGIGLSLVKSLVGLHGGKISVSSEVGCGSEFYIELPVNSDYEGAYVSETSGTEKKDHVERINIEFSDIYQLN